LGLPQRFGVSLRRTPKLAFFVFSISVFLVPFDAAISITLMAAFFTSVII
jgi:hypothetical protein